MRFLYIDIDSLRPDHLGCYGYHRNTSPNIDALAAQADRFDNYYASDAPCLPSRTALWSGRFGARNGVVNHGGVAASPFLDGPERAFRDEFARTSWMSALRQAGYETVTVSSFGERHAAWHWYAGYSQIYNPGFGGLERADQVAPIAIDWLKRNGQTDNWFLHVNLWDPHTPYRTPDAFGDPFADDPLPAWLTEEVRQACWQGYGPMSARELNGYPSHSYAHTASQTYPRIPAQLDSMAAVRQWINGYDTGVRYADEHVGQLLNTLADQGILEDTVVIVSADHGENQGELNIWGDHQTADQITCRVPLIVRWPGITDAGRVENALHYHFDWAATLLEMVGQSVPANWDARPFTRAFQERRTDGRPYLVLSQGAWTCQRSVRFEADGRSFLCIRTYHDGHKDLAPLMLFDLSSDPHEQHNLAETRPDLADHAMRLLSEWQHEIIASTRSGVDPMMTVIKEGGPFHTRGELPAYLEHLRATGRGHHADRLAATHPTEAAHER
jgi:arylsulfatase A-like enzyme